MREAEITASPPPYPTGSRHVVFMLLLSSDFSKRIQHTPRTNPSGSILEAQRLFLLTKHTSILTF